MKKIISLTYLIVSCLGQIALGQSYLEAFTHPVGNLKQNVSIYSSPYVYCKDITSDVEGGWVVYVHERNNNYFRIDIEDLGMYNVWIHCGDIGANIQNYDCVNIPIYSSIHKKKCDTSYISQSYTAIIYDFEDPFVFVKIDADSNSNSLYGWIHKKYLCGSPYTTCP